MDGEENGEQKLVLKMVYEEDGVGMEPTGDQVVDGI